MKKKYKERPFAETGERICTIRSQMPCKEGKGMSQREFSEMLDIDDKKLSRIENGIQDIGGSVLLKISQVTGLSIDVILKGEASNSSVITIEQCQKFLVEIEKGVNGIISITRKNLNI